MIPARVTIGTRGSALARVQADLVVGTLQQRFPALAVETRVISTRGDRVQDVSITQLGDKGVFVRALERALLAGEIDLAVHSLKDVPADSETAGLQLVAFLRRADPRDALIDRDGLRLSELRAGALVGTGSLRRRVQLRALRPDLRVADIRGNVDTRLRKLDDGEYDALILAAAGLLRLGLDGRVIEFLPVEDFTPDAGQGIVAVQGRKVPELVEIAAQLDDRAARRAAEAERACVRALGADCRSPVGVYATMDGEELRVAGMTAEADGSSLRRAQVLGSADDPTSLGKELAVRLQEAPPIRKAGETRPYTEQ